MSVLNHFLDTCIIIGYCFFPDKWHYESRRYLDKYDGDSFYSSKTCEKEFESKHKKLINKFRRAILRHRKAVERSSLEGTLNSLDIRKISAEVPSDIRRFMHEYYSKQIPPSITKDDLLSRLRHLARDVETQPLSLYRQLCESISFHRASLPDGNVKSFFTDCLHTNDLRILLDAHDLAYRRSPLYLVTTNTRDFYEFRKDIAEHTKVEKIRDLNVNPLA